VTEDDGLAARPGMRADARRNRERILVAARDVFVERGADAPLEEIAARAGVGIATLYRRFPERVDLMRAVVLDVMQRAMVEIDQALSEEPDAFRSLERYMHRALELRVSAVVPALLGRVSMDDAEIVPLRRRGATLIEEIIARAHRDGTLRPDVTSGDIALLMIRMSRPLPGPVVGEVANNLAHRHLDLLLDGLRPDRGPLSSLPGPSLSIRELRTKLGPTDAGESSG
jgi:AcrR family transcriptional regulator